MRLVLTSLLMMAASAQAAPRAKRDVVSTLEHSLRTVKDHHDDNITALRGPHAEVSLRPAQRTIIVSRGLRETGFRLGTDGKFSSEDRGRLSELLQKDPGATRAQVVRTLRASLTQRRAEIKKLAAANPRIDGFLTQATRAPEAERELFSGSGGTLSYRMGGSGPMLTITRGMSQRAVFLRRDAKGGLALDPADREEVARVLTR